VLPLDSTRLHVEVLKCTGPNNRQQGQLKVNLLPFYTRENMHAALQLGLTAWDSRPILKNIYGLKEQTQDFY